MTEATPDRVRLIAYARELLNGDVVPAQDELKGGTVKSTANAEDGTTTTITYRDRSTDVAEFALIINVDRLVEHVPGYDPETGIA